MTWVSQRFSLGTPVSSTTNDLSCFGHRTAEKEPIKGTPKLAPVPHTKATGTNLGLGNFTINKRDAIGVMVVISFGKTYFYEWV